MNNCIEGFSLLGALGLNEELMDGSDRVLESPHPEPYVMARERTRNFGSCCWLARVTSNCITQGQNEDAESGAPVSWLAKALTTYTSVFFKMLLI